MVLSFTYFVMNTQTSLVFLNTRDSRDVNNFNTSWTVEDPKLTNNPNTLIALQHMEFSNTVYPINAQNNILSITDDGGTDLLAVTPGSYTGTSLASAIAALMNGSATLSGAYTVVYDSLISRLLTFTIVGGTVSFQFNAVDKNIYEETGILTLGTPFTSLYETENVLDISGTRYVDVIMPNFSTFNWTSTSTSAVLARIPIDVPFGFVLTYEAETDDNLFVSTRSLNEITMRLIDDHGRLWELPNNSHVSLVLKLKHLL